MASNSPQFRCVYSDIPEFCPGNEPPSDEHYLPRGLGKFKGFECLSNTICQFCNNKFGQLEEVFLRNSPEAFFREMIGRLGRSQNRTKAIFYEPTFGTPPISMLGKPPYCDYDILLEVDRGFETKPMRQIILRDDQGEHHPVFIRDSITEPNQFRELLEDQGLEEAKPVAAFCDPEVEEERIRIENLLRDYPNSDLQQLHESAPEGSATISVDLTFNINPMYYRAIAKIAFHFFLKFSSRFTGEEPEFLPLRRFIALGSGNVTDFVNFSRNQFLLNYQAGQVPKGWLHLLTYSTRDFEIVSRMSFFGGPQHLPIVWNVRLGRNPSRLYVRDSAGRAFAYHEGATPDSEFHGEIDDLTAVNHIVPLPFLNTFRRL